MGGGGRSFRSFLGGDRMCSPPSLPLPPNLGLSPGSSCPSSAPGSLPTPVGVCLGTVFFPQWLTFSLSQSYLPWRRTFDLSQKSGGGQAVNVILIGEWVIAAQTPRVVNEIQRTLLNGTLIGIWGTVLPTELSGKPKVEYKRSKVPGCDLWKRHPLVCSYGLYLALA